MKFLKVSYLLAVLIVTVIFATIYATTQYTLRTSANDPQIQIAEDIANNLKSGTTSPQNVVNSTIQPNKSLAPFVMVYFKDTSVAASGALLNGVAPKVPEGVLRAATPTHQNRVTWQPQKGVRLATIVTATDTYYILVARSLREVENREQLALCISFIGWLTAVLVVFIWQLQRK